MIVIPALNHVNIAFTDESKLTRSDLLMLPSVRKKSLANADHPSPRNTDAIKNA